MSWLALVSAWFVLHTVQALGDRSECQKFVTLMGLILEKAEYNVSYCLVLRRKVEQGKTVCGELFI